MGFLLWQFAIFSTILAIQRNAQGVKPPQIISFPEDDMDAKGEIKKDFRIRCKVTGDNVEFTWKQFRLDDSNARINEYKRVKNSGGYVPVTVEADGTLVASRAIAQRDNGYYQCFAKNAGGTVFSRKLRLQVTSVSDFVPNSPKDLGKQDTGTIVSINCPNLEDSLSYGFVRSWGRSDPQQGTTNELGYKENRIVRASDGQLTFSPLTSDDCEFFKNNKDINCKVEAANTFYTSAKTAMQCSAVTKDVKVAPEFVQALPSTKEATEGKEFNLYCAAKGSPTPKVKWFFNDKPAEIKDGENGYELSALKYNRFLKITRVNRVKHEGKYTCKVSNTEGKLESSTTLTVLVRPKLSEPKPPDYQEIPINSKASIKCLATGNPAPSFTWWRNGQILPSSGRAVATNNILTFPKAELQDDGLYQCVASNKVGMVVTNTEIKVKAEKPSFKSFGPFSLFKQSTGKLTCQPEAAPKADMFIWYYNGKQLTTNITSGRYTLTSDGTLFIENVGVRDQGKFQCNAKNIVGNTTSPEGASKVYDQTYIKVPPKNLTVPEGQVFDLRCEASFDKRLEIKYFWLRDGAKLNNIQNSAGRIYWDDSKNILRVNMVKTDDGGEYTCVAFTPGPQSEARATAIVDIKGVPYPPYDLKITDCTDLSTTLSWTTGSPNDSPITSFLVEQESDFEPNVFKMIKNVTTANATSTSLILTPWANLRFRIRAVNRFGPSRGSTPTTKDACKTKEAAPTKYPDSLRGVPGGPEDLSIAWTPLTKLEQNAPECKYLLEYKRKDSSTWQKKTIEDCSVGVFKVDNAGYYIEWQFTIQARNRKGKGPVSPLVSAFSGQDAPIYAPQNLRDIKPEARSVEITWDPVPIDPKRGRGSIDGYRIFYVPDGKAAGKSARRRRAIPENAFSAEVLTKDACVAKGSCKHEFKGFQPFQKYRLAMKAFNSGGNGPPSDEASFETKEDVPSVPVDVNVIPFGKYILLRWGRPAEANGIMTGYSVGVVKTGGNQLVPEKPDLKTKLKSNQFEHLFEDLQYSTDYRVGVAGETGAGIGPAVYLSAPTVRKMEPAKPALPKAKGVTPSSVNVTFEYGIGGGYPTEFMVKYREKIDSQGVTTPDPAAEYKESDWVKTKERRWVVIEKLSNTLHEFRTIGQNLEGSSIQSDPVYERPLAGILAGKRVSSPFYASAWFIVLIVIILILLLVLIILVLVKKQRGAKYPVGKREKERAGILDTFPEDEEAGYEPTSRDVENPPPYQSQGSLDKPSLDNESDRDSLDDYGEGPQFNEDGSFIGEYGDEDKKNVPADKDKQALATFV